MPRVYGPLKPYNAPPPAFDPGTMGDNEEDMSAGTPPPVNFSMPNDSPRIPAGVMPPVTPPPVSLDTSQNEAEIPNYPPPFKPSEPSARDRYKQMVEQGPKRSILGTLAAAAVGGAAGYLNASGKNMRPVNVDPDAMANLATGGYNGRLKRAATAANIEAQQEAAGLAKRKTDAEIAHYESQTAKDKAMTELAGRKIVPIPGTKGAYIDYSTGQPVVHGELTPSLKAQVQDRADVAEERGWTEETHPGVTQWIAEGKFGAAPPDRTPKSFEQAATQIAINEKDPAIRDQQIKSLADAYRQLHPEAPITHWEVDDRGNVHVKSTTPSAVAAAGGSVNLGPGGKTKQTPVGATDEAKAARETVAQSLANGELVDVGRLVSMRAGERELVFARAKQLNPQFDMSKVSRQIKMQDSVDNGTISTQIQSFDQFIQHADSAINAVSQIQNTNSALLNKSINWIRANAKSSPQYRAALAAIEPVKKEFESFLLNNRALYAEDRASADKILSEDVPLSDFISAVKAMGHITEARYRAINQKYRNLMGKDIPNAFSQEAEEGAKRIGIKLNGGNQQQGGNGLKGVSTDELMRRLTNGR